MITLLNCTQPLRKAPDEHANDSKGVHRFLDGKPLPKHLSCICITYIGDNSDCPKHGAAPKAKKPVQP